MKYALAAFVLVIPAIGYAQSIDDAALQTTFDECVNSCDAVHVRGFCNEICGCMTGEMRPHWDEDDFRRRIERLQGDAADPDVRAEMDRLAQYSAARIQYPDLKSTGALSASLLMGPGSAERRPKAASGSRSRNWKATIARR